MAFWARVPASFPWRPLPRRRLETVENLFTQVRVRKSRVATNYVRITPEFRYYKELFVIRRAIPLVRLYSALVDRSCLLVKWFRERVRVRVRVRAGARECITLYFFFFSYKMWWKSSLRWLDSLWVDLRCHTSRDRTPTWVNKFSPIILYGLQEVCRWWSVRADFFFGRGSRT